MTEYSGTNRKFTPIAQIDGMSEYQANTRMRVKRELQRRDGLSATNIPPAGAPILSIVSGFTAQGGAAVVTQSSPGGIPSVQGTKGAKSLWQDIILLPPGGGHCTLFDPLSDTGTTSKLSALNPPAGSCQGTIAVSGTESGGGQGFTAYGYQFSIECFKGGALQITYNTGCLINSSTSFVLPPGCDNVSYDITGGCNGGSTPGTWSIGITTP